MIANTLAVGVVLTSLCGSLLNSPLLVIWGSNLGGMLPNTTFCLLALAAGLAAHNAGRPRAARILGLAVVVVAGITLSQYFTGRDYQIDQLFLSPSTRSVHTSPNTSVALILFGFALIFAAVTGPLHWAAPACAGGALALALLAFLGYATGLMPAFRWGTLPSMSLPTITAILFLTTSFFAGARARNEPLELGMPLFATAIVILAAVSASSVITNARLIENNQWVRHSLETRESLRSIGQQMEAADRIERSHYNTADPGDAARLTLAEQEVWRQFTLLHAQVAPESAQLHRTTELESLLREKLRLVRNLFARGALGQIPAADRKREVIISLDSTDAVTKELDDMLDDEAEALATRSAAAETSAEQTRRLNWLAGVISLALLAAAIVAQSQARRSRETARKAMEAAHDSAIEASRLKSEFLANMSHELRTPMNGIIGMSELLLEAPLAPKHREMSEMVLHSAEALLKIINDILDFSKIEAGRMHIDTQPFGLRQIMEDCTLLLAPRAHEKEVELVLDYDALLPAHFIGDGGRVRQVMMNLVGNAVKFTPSGEILIRVALKRMLGSRASIRVEVRDTGEGIASEAQGRLFEPFTQADAATTRRFGGTGLGLAISRQLVELMKGSIGFESSEGKGSMFWFELELPLDEVQPPDASHRELVGRRFLVVDDNANNRKVIAAQLASMGAEAECAAGAAEALASLDRRGPFTAVLLDWHMPERDGLSLARELRATGRVGGGRPGSEWLVLLSSAAFHSLVDGEFLFDAMLMKPVRVAELQRALLRLIHGGIERKPTPRPTAPAVVSPKSATDRTLSLLLVEDNLSNQRVARILLERLGHQVEVAADGEAALRALADHRYDAVLMDCQMPVLDGYEATRRIRAGEAPGVNPDICIIALTANAMPSDRLKCLSAGMSDFVTKPVRLDDLRTVLARNVAKESG
jgi:signal transduction histidine kinase/CheY-like chemotaxis protein